MMIAVQLVLLVVLGPLFLYYGLRNRRSLAHGTAESPRPRWRPFARAEAWGSIVIGAVFTLCLVAVLIQFLSE